MKRPGRHDTNGFTLSELLCVVALMGMLLIALSSFDSDTYRIEKAFKDVSFYTDGLARTRDRLGTDIRLARKATALPVRPGNEQMLELFMTDGRTLKYYLRNQKLIRKSPGPEGKAISLFSGIKRFSPVVDGRTGLISLELQMNSGDVVTMSFALRNGGKLP
ncbi:prepilin-type N-terminal cleavage/methylation domain-containing protein [Acidobacteriota bacterium]